MANLNFRNIFMSSHERHWPIAIAALAVGAAFFSLWFWLLPQWLGFRVEMADAPHWRWLAALPSVFGFAVAMRCAWEAGLGTGLRLQLRRRNAWWLSASKATTLVASYSAHRYRATWRRAARVKGVASLHG